MAKQTISIGTTANDGTGTSIRGSYDITNDNFDELYAALGGDDLSGGLNTSADHFGIQTSKTPASSTGAAGDAQGDIAWDASYIYVCTADYDGSTAIWARAAIASW